MQWDALITSVGGAGVVLGVVGYFLKRSFEGVLETKLKESEERYKALLAETVRRQAALYDKQSEVLKTIVSLIYRARNAAGEIKKADGKVNKDAINRLGSYNEAISELLFEQRAILPSRVFQIAHETKHQVRVLMEAGVRQTRKESDTPHIAEDFRVNYELLETNYQRLVSIVQNHFGVEDKPA